MNLYSAIHGLGVEMIASRFFVCVVICLALVSCSGLSNQDSIRKLASIEIPQCTTECNQYETCINTFTDRGAQCVQTPKTSPIDFFLPFDMNTEVVCTHSSGSGSHSGSNAYFALDLATDYSKPASIIRASADGTAYVFMSEDGELCPEPEGTSASSESSACGKSWGNHIRILHSNGYLSFYVHLERPLVKNGDFVKRGDPIGVEGKTGAAGHRHLHWSVQKLPGSTLADWIDRISWDGESVPFKFKARQNGLVQTFDTASIKCAHAGIGSAPISQQPRFRGVK